MRNERQPARTAPSVSSAPSACPTSVEPAMEKPKPATMQMFSMFTPMLYAANACVP